jgi:DNA polymerase-4
MGVTTVGHLRKIPEDELRARFGSHGTAMANQAQGIDSRRVVTEHRRRSVSQERTFSQDLSDPTDMLQKLWSLSQGVGKRLRKSEVAASTVGLKVRYADFTTLTRQMTLAVPTDDEKEIYRAVSVLFQRTWQTGRRVRLLGVSAKQLSAPAGQLPLWT